MFYNRFKPSTMIMIGLLSIGLVGLAGCAKADSAQPEFEPFSSLPMAVTVNQISADYAADEDAADAKYKGEELLFNMVVVEEAQITTNRTKFTSGGVVFIIGASIKTRNIEPGFILNIEGKYAGLSVMENLPTITVSFIDSVKGDIGATVAVSGY